MARLSKAKRVKRRWVGLRLNRAPDRAFIESEIQSLVPDSDLRLFDLQKDGQYSIAIVRVPLHDLPRFRMVAQEYDWIEPLTTSGKIRLVRERLGILKPPVRR